MFGLACGDALGAPVEFLSQEQALAKYGYVTEMHGGGIWEPGEWTDDTAMALAVAEGLHGAGRTDTDAIEQIGNGFLAWLYTSPKDVGNTISQALRRFRLSGSWAEASRGTPSAQAGKGAGNGSLMRTLPIAFALRDTAKMARLSARVSAMTHWDAQAEVCCLLYNLWVRSLAQAEPGKNSVAGMWQQAVTDAQTIAAKGNLSPSDIPGPAPLPSGFWERLQAVPNLRENQLQPSGYSGYVLECLECAAWWVMHTQSLEDCIVGCVNMAGEADTNAAVAGGAAGAFYGYKAIPKRWLQALHESERIKKAADGLLELQAEAHFAEKESPG